MTTKKKATETGERQVRVEVRGRVQGVWYRAGTRERARELGLMGWVRNREDGSVELVARGAPGSIDALVAWCRRGPPGARVVGVDVLEEAPGGRLAEFEIR